MRTSPDSENRSQLPRGCQWRASKMPESSRFLARPEIPPESQAAFEKRLVPIEKKLLYVSVDVIRAIISENAGGHIQEGFDMKDPLLGKPWRHVLTDALMDLQHGAYVITSTARIQTNPTLPFVQGGITTVQAVQEDPSGGVRSARFSFNGLLFNTEHELVAKLNDKDALVDAQVGNEIVAAYMNTKRNHVALQRANIQHKLFSQPEVDAALRWVRFGTV